MWGLLSDLGHAESFDHLGDAYVPMRRLVEQLARREYASRVYGVKSLAAFGLTTAPIYAQADGHDHIGIGYNPDSGLFAIGYAEWVSPTRNPQRRTASSRVCEAAEAVEAIDRYVLRLLLSRRRME